MLKLSCKFGESKWNPYWIIMLTNSSGTNYVLNGHEDVDRLICSTFKDNSMLKLSWKFGESKWYPYCRAGVKYVLSNTNANTNTKIWIFQIQIQIQIFCSILIQIQIQIQIHRFKYKYKYKYVQPNISAETVQIQNRAILWIPRYMPKACVSLWLGDTWS